MADTRVGLLEAGLSAKGFVRVERPVQFQTGKLKGPDFPDLWFHGALRPSRGRVDAYLYVPDLTFVTAPTIWLAERPQWLTGWRPRLLGTGVGSIENLCYNDFEQYQLLAHDVVAAALRVLIDATETLNRISNPNSVIEDSRKDFPRLWQSDFQRVYVDCLPTKDAELCETASHTSPDGILTLLVSKKSRDLASLIGIRGPLKSGSAAVIFPEEGAGLHLTAAGPANNLKEVREWLKSVAPETLERWTKQQLRQKYWSERVRHHFFVSRGQVIGFTAAYPNSLSRVHGARAMRDAIASTVYQKPVEIIRLHAERLDSAYLVRRNLPPGASDLRGKRVLLIGAGAVGGFLAQGLVKLGAGLSAEGDQQGSLTICDKDVLSPGNIGRHLLGFEFLGQAKASALCLHLQRSHPGCSLFPIDSQSDFRPDSARLAKVDVIVDATGYETYSRYLSRLCRTSGWLAKPDHVLLQVWIEGRGAVVRGLLQDETGDACYDCLTNLTPNVEPVPRYPAYTTADWTKHSDDGYATMTPFSVSAPLLASALGIDMLTAHAGGPKAAKFVSRAIDATGVNAGVSKTLARAAKCPGCSA